MCMLFLCKINSDALSEAVTNTIVGMGAVFVVLIVISNIISWLKYIDKLVVFFDSHKEERKRKKIKKANENVSIKNTFDAGDNNIISEAILDNDELEEINDGELVTVITAAIMAYMGDEVAKDNLVVRSIRRVRR